MHREEITYKNFFLIKILLITKLSGNSIGDEGDKELSLGLKLLIKLNSLTMDLR
jgi:hypothetical protein